MIDFSKAKAGDLVFGHCCDRCMHDAGLTPKSPADSGSHSLYCHCCGHYGIGSTVRLLIGPWLSVEPAGGE